MYMKEIYSIIKIFKKLSARKRIFAKLSMKMQTLEEFFRKIKEKIFLFL